MSDERHTIQFFFDRGLNANQISKKLKPYKVKRARVFYTVKRLRETGSIYDRPRSGRPRTVRTPKMIRRVKARIWRNPQRSGRRMAPQLSIKRESLRKIITEDLGFRPFKKRKLAGLTPAHIEKRHERCKQLLSRYEEDGVDNIVYCDEKLFLKEEVFNSQNVRVYALSIEDVPAEMRSVERFQYEESQMVFGAISKKGKFTLHFVEPGKTVTGKYYKEEILEKLVKVEADAMFGDNKWTFQQDSARAHTANIVQDYCKEEFPDFIGKDEWPPGSCDLNPLDYCVWGFLEARVNAKRHTSLESMRKAIKQEWDNLPMKMVRAAIDSWLKRLRACIAAKGGRFEHNL